MYIVLKNPYLYIIINKQKLNIMTGDEILKIRQENEAKLLDYFTKVNIPTDRLQKVEIYNGRNNRVPALQLICKDEQEFNYHQTAFFYADSKGGDFFQCNFSLNILRITIKDGWN